MSTYCQLLGCYYVAASENATRAEDESQRSDHSDDKMTEIDCMLTDRYSVSSSCRLRISLGSSDCFRAWKKLIGCSIGPLDHVVVALPA